MAWTIPYLQLLAAAGVIMSVLWCTVVGCNVEEDRSTASHSLKAAADASKADTPDASHGAVLAHDTRHEGHKVVQLRAKGASPCMLWRDSVAWRVIGRGRGHGGGDAVVAARIPCAHSLLC